MAMLVYQRVGKFHSQKYEFGFNLFLGGVPDYTISMFASKGSDRVGNRRLLFLVGASTVMKSQW